MYFIKEPEREFHVREVAELIKKSPTTASKYLLECKKKGLLLSRKKLNHLLYKANNENVYFKDIKRKHNISKLRDSGLIEYLSKQFNHPEAIILFGSYAKAEDIPTSDIDVVVISPVKRELNLARFEKALGHPIQLFVFSKQRMESMKTKNKELLNNLINGVVLEGFLELFR